MTEDRILGLLGMAQRAGRVASGGFAVEKLIQSGRAVLVIVAKDASENTRKMFRNKCEFYEVAYAEISTREKLGRAIGKEERVSIALEDEGFSGAILKLIRNERSIEGDKNGST